MKGSIIKAPNKIPDDNRFKVFLAGSIDMGDAPNWQKVVGEDLAKLGLTVLDPRRDDWDASWVQSIDNPQFREQVEWELDALELADLILVHFSATGPAPITLLELGLFARSGKVVVHCEEGYWRKGNVEIVCNKYGVPMVDSLNKLAKQAIARGGFRL